METISTHKVYHIAHVCVQEKKENFVYSIHKLIEIGSAQGYNGWIKMGNFDFYLGYQAGFWKVDIE